MADDIIDKGTQKRTRKIVSGIYVIRNTVNGKIYVGSSRRIVTRWREHKHALKHGKHTPILQRSWNKHGEIAFSFEILEEVTEINNLCVREQFWIDKLEAANETRGFNIFPIAGGGARGYKYSAEAREKMKEKRHSPETCAKMSASQKGKKHSEETRAKLSVSRRKRTTSDATRAKMSASWKGRKVSPETRVKMSVAQKGKKLSEEGRAKLRAYHAKRRQTLAKEIIIQGQLSFLY